MEAKLILPSSCVYGCPLMYGMLWLMKWSDGCPYIIDSVLNSSKMCSCITIHGCLQLYQCQQWICFAHLKISLKAQRKNKYTITAAILACSSANFHVNKPTDVKLINFIICVIIIVKFNWSQFSMHPHVVIDKEFCHNIAKVVCESTCLDCLSDPLLLSHYYDSWSITGQMNEKAMQTQSGNLLLSNSGFTPYYIVGLYRRWVSGLYYSVT